MNRLFHRSCQCSQLPCHLLILLTCLLCRIPTLEQPYYLPSPVLHQASKNYWRKSTKQTQLTVLWICAHSSQGNIYTAADACSVSSHKFVSNLISFFKLSSLPSLILKTWLSLLPHQGLISSSSLYTLFSQHEPLCATLKCPLVLWILFALSFWNWSIYDFPLSYLLQSFFPIHMNSLPTNLSVKLYLNYHPPPSKSKLCLPLPILYFFILIHSLIL